MQSLKALAIGLVGFVMLAAAPATAQDLVTVTETGINFAPLFENYVLPVVGTAISALIMWGITKASKLVGIQIDDRQRDLIFAVVDRGISAGRAWVGASVRDKLDVSVKSAIAQQTALYANNKIPGALKHFKLTPEDLNGIILARMAELQDYDDRTAVPAAAFTDPPPEVQPDPAPAKPAAKKKAA